MKKLTEQVVVTKPIIKQILELPPESVILLRAGANRFSAPIPTVLHRTGTDGWLFTRSSTQELAGVMGSKYLHKEHVERLVEDYGSSLEAFVLFDPTTDNA